MIYTTNEGRDKMKLRTVIHDGDEEIVISCRERSEKVIFIEDLIKNAIGQGDTLLLTSGDLQYFIPIKEIIFCESFDGHSVCHTKDKVLSSSYRLFELEKILSPVFCRASKSTLINCHEVYSVKKNLAGPSEISFRSTAKKAYLSRSYYKMFMEKMNETRL